MPEKTTEYSDEENKNKNQILLYSVCIIQKLKGLE